MRSVDRSEIVDYQTYEEGRTAFRTRVMREKDRRRIHVGAHLTLLFENPLTVRYQVQEMMRAEKIVKEADILHELETYNEILGGEGELGATLLIEIDDPAERDRKLRAWLALPEHLYARLEDGERVRPRFDQRQRGADRVSSVQYVKFPVRGRVPVAFGCDLPDLTCQAQLSAEQRKALEEDLGV